MRKTPKQRREQRRENARWLGRMAEILSRPPQWISVPIGNVGISRRLMTPEEIEQKERWEQQIVSAFRRMR